MAASDTRVVTAHLPLPLAEQLDALAERLERPKGWVVRQALAAYVEEEERRRQLTLQALADVDAGRGIAHRDMKEWAAGLGADELTPPAAWK